MVYIANNMDPGQTALIVFASMLKSSLSVLGCMNRHKSRQHFQVIKLWQIRFNL